MNEWMNTFIIIVQLYNKILVSHSEECMRTRTYKNKIKRDYKNFKKIVQITNVNCKIWHTRREGQV